MTARSKSWRSDTTRHKPQPLEIASRCPLHCMCPTFHSLPLRCASLHMSRSSRWQRRGQKSRTRAHCHLCHAGTSGICEASARSACRDIRHGEQEMRSEKTRSPNRHDYQATGVLLTWDGQPRVSHVPHNPLFADASFVVNSRDICLLQLRTCIRRRHPYHVPSQTDLINHCSHLSSFETKINRKMASGREERHELDPWNDNNPKRRDDRWT